MSEDKELPAKDEVAALLLRQGSVFVHLDPRLERVQVPKWFGNQPQLVLQIGYDMPLPIPDLRVDRDGVFGTLSFSRSPFTCFVPWDAVFAMAGDDGRGMIWPDAMPKELEEEVAREAGLSPPPALTLVGDEDEEADAAEVISLQERRDSQVPPAPGDSKPPKRSNNKKQSSRKLPDYLKVIK